MKIGDCVVTKEGTGFVESFTLSGFFIRLDRGDQIWSDNDAVGVWIINDIGVNRAKMAKLEQKDSGTS